jgi:RNA polymerase sigma factor (sigma-70 family)
MPAPFPVAVTAAKPQRRTTGLLYHETCPRKRRAEERMVAEHVPLLKLIIKQQRHKYHCLELDDLYSLGLIGLLKAVRRFDPERGFKFSSIALPFILGEWRHYIRDHNFWLKAPGSVRQRGMQARRLLEICAHLLRHGRPGEQQQCGSDRRRGLLQRADRATEPPSPKSLARRHALASTA